MPLLGRPVGRQRRGQSGQWHPPRWARSCGSPPENHLVFPNWEVGDVWAAPREEHALELVGESDTWLLGVKDGIHHILVSKPIRCLNPPP